MTQQQQIKIDTLGDYTQQLQEVAQWLIQYRNKQQDLESRRSTWIDLEVAKDTGVSLDQLIKGHNILAKKAFNDKELYEIK